MLHYGLPLALFPKRLHLFLRHDTASLVEDALNILRCPGIGYIFLLRTSRRFEGASVTVKPDDGVLLRREPFGFSPNSLISQAFHPFQAEWQCLAPLILTRVQHHLMWWGRQGKPAIASSAYVHQDSQKKREIKVALTRASLNPTHYMKR